MRTPRDRGQAAVEFAIVVPAVVVLVLGIVQVVSVAGRQIALEHAARAGARAASVAADPSAAARSRVVATTSLDPITVTTTATATSVTVTVSYTDPTSAPIVGNVIGDVELEASATMPREPP